MNSQRSGIGKNSGVDSLSERELEVFELIGTGKTTSSIAVQLSCSPKTIESYRERIKQKLGIKNATELVSYASSMRY